MTAAHRRISERVSAITESATLAVDAKAKALKAAGRPVIGFGAGEPDFPTPDYILAAAQRASVDYATRVEFRGKQFRTDNAWRELARRA